MARASRHSGARFKREDESTCHYTWENTQRAPIRACDGETLQLRQHSLANKDLVPFPHRRWERNGSQNRGLGDMRRWSCVYPLNSTQPIPREYLSKILCGCITLLTTWVMWSWAATTSGGGLYLFTAATFSRIRNARRKEVSFLKRWQGFSSTKHSRHATR